MYKFIFPPVCVATKNVMNVHIDFIKQVVKCRKFQLDIFALGPFN